jgi:hypothetical protein
VDVASPGGQAGGIGAGGGHFVPDGAPRAKKN